MTAVCPPRDEYERDVSERAGPRSRPTWLDLYDVLSPRRPEWRFESDLGEGTMAWCLGFDTEARVVTVEAGRVNLFVYDTDEDIEFISVGGIADWADKHEAEYAEPSALYRQLTDHLLPGEVEKWANEDGN